MDEALPRANSSSSSSHRSSSSASRRSSSDSSSSRDGDAAFKKAARIVGRNVDGGKTTSDEDDERIPSSKKNRRVEKAKVIEDLSLFYALATLTNLCESPVYRAMIVGVGRFDVIPHLVDILDSLNATSDDALMQVIITN